jgi:DNA-binding XRE family transcriptional regulator
VSHDSVESQTYLQDNRKLACAQVAQNLLLMKTLGEQVRAFREERDWNTAQMAKAVGTSRQNIESLEQHGNRVPKYLGALAAAMGKSADELLQTAGLAPRTVTLPAPFGVEGKDVTILQFATGGAMGAGLLLKDQPGVIRAWNVTREWVEKNVPYYTSLENLAIVTGFGDSMLGMFNPGDPLLVDRGINRADVDGVYFFRVGDEGFIKRLQRIPGEGIVVISENPKYRDWTIKPGMDFEVMAKVLKSWNGQAL